MRKILVFSALIMMVALTNICFADSIPSRKATPVDDVFEPYTADNWIVSPDEEQEGDQISNEVLESDIRAAIACYDQDYLRVDILLYNSNSYQWDNFYAIEFEYDKNIYEYYTYYPDTNELVYTQEKNGQTIKRQLLDLNKSDDQAGVTSSGGEIKDDNIYFIINKNKHLTGEKGKTYYLTTKFIAGYVDVDKKLVIADETIDVNLHFVK